MTTEQHKAYAAAEKKFWVLYTVIVICVLLFLFFFVAQDTEEQVFYSLMGAAVAYVFRPSMRFTAHWTQRLFGVAKPEPEVKPADLKPEDKAENSTSGE